ncbi:MAG: acyltransferase [Microgenomates group bacterium]
MSTDNDKRLRFDVLDGLRGFAIILVFLNHIDSHFIAEALPSFIRPFIYFLFTSGNLGVTFFFILSGFLMGYLYTNPHPIEFIERRYARIFPPFLVMVSSMFIFRLFPTLPLFFRIATMMGIALFVRLVWIYIVERFRFGSVAIKLFLFLQMLVAIWYGLVIMRHPPIWFDSLPYLLKEGTIFATNATLTLSLGNYIPLLDGVYWSLAPEMIFYLLYPYIFAPTVHMLRKKNWRFIIAFILSLFPFLAGLSILFKHSQGLSMLFIEYFIYFCGGIALASYLHISDKKIRFPFAKSIITPLFFITLLFLAYLFLGMMTGWASIVTRLFYVFPFGFIVYELMTEKTPLSRLFQHRIFLFLGTISYSMYIGHTAIVDGMHLMFKPTDALTNILFLFITGSIFMLTSYALHLIIEKPYFQFKPAKNREPFVFKKNIFPYIALFSLISILFLSSYASQFNFFSLQKKYTNVIPSSVTIFQEPYVFSFTAQEDNMGVILVHLTNTVGDVLPQNAEKIDPNKHQRFQIRMKEIGSEEWYASQDTAPGEIGNSSSYPFGFPVIADSKGKTYLVEMSMKDIDYTSKIIFNKDFYQLTTVHQIPKQTLLRNPVQLLTHMGDKFQTILMNPEARLTALCVMPFFILLFVLLYVS